MSKKLQKPRDPKRRRVPSSIRSDFGRIHIVDDRICIGRLSTQLDGMAFSQRLCDLYVLVSSPSRTPWER